MNGVVSGLMVSALELSYGDDHIQLAMRRFTRQARQFEYAGRRSQSRLSPLRIVFERPLNTRRKIDLVLESQSFLFRRVTAPRMHPGWLVG